MRWWVNRIGGLTQVADGLLVFLGFADKAGLTLRFYAWELRSRAKASS